MSLYCKIHDFLYITGVGPSTDFWSLTLNANTIFGFTKFSGGFSGDGKLASKPLISLQNYTLTVDEYEENVNMLPPCYLSLYNIPEKNYCRTNHYISSQNIPKSIYSLTYTLVHDKNQVNKESHI
jgi:hypothetical protein